MSRRKPRRARQSMSALDTLAEVSRHHPDILDRIQTSVNHDQQQDTPNNNLRQDDEVMIDHCLVQGEKRPREDEFEVSESGTLINANVRQLPSPSELSGNPEHASTTFQLPSLINVRSDNTVTSSSSSISSMILTASAAANSKALAPHGIILEPDICSPNASISDKYFRSQKRIDSLWPIHAIDPILHSSKRSSFTSRENYEARVREQPQLSTAHVETGHDASAGEDKLSNFRTLKSKARCKFSDERRKEVQEVRRQGACIRCRMLKKPCSNETPCSTCISVESARLWKQPCVRTRIADELTFFSAGLYQAMASHATKKIRNRVQYEVSTDKIKATHFPMDDFYLDFAPRKALQPNDTALSPLPVEAEEQFRYISDSTVLLDLQDKDVADKIERYVHTISVGKCGLGISDFMNVTCNTAKTLTPDEKSIFISQILDLWTATQILTNTLLKWTLYSLPSSKRFSSSPSTPTSESPDTDTIQTEISPSEQPKLYNMIVLQLLAATERYAAKLGKAIMNELERRLLQRRQASPFETFVVTIILLACTGQMAWYFRKLELESYCKGPILNTEAGWPLDKPSSHYIEQSEQLRDLLYMLLKTRGIPSNSKKGKGCSNDSSKSRDRNKKRKGNEDASQHAIEGKNTDSESMKDDYRDMLANESNDKLRSMSASSSSTANFFVNEDDNATITNSPDQVVSSPIEDNANHLQHNEIQDRWYAAVRDAILDDLNDYNDDFVTQDTFMEINATKAAKKLERSQRKVGVIERDAFDPSNPQSWELKYTRALLRLGI